MVRRCTALPSELLIRIALPPFPGWMLRLSWITSFEASMLTGSICITRRRPQFPRLGLEGGAGFEPTASPCAMGRASESTSRPCSRHHFCYCEQCVHWCGNLILFRRHIPKCLGIRFFLHFCSTRGETQFFRYGSASTQTRKTIHSRTARSPSFSVPDPAGYL